MKFVPVAFILLVSALCTDLGAATLYVANNGVDSTACGAQSSPCRSINQAMASASAGDTILVGPGRYGDLTDGETFFTFPGEEMPPAGSEYLIVVDKPLTIESTHGADATRLNLGFFFLGVQILADNVVFGRPGKGFMFESFETASVVLGAGTNGNSVGGIVGTEFIVDGNGHSLTHNKLIHGNCSLTVRGTAHTISRNVVGCGVEIQGAGISFTDNLVVSSSIAVSDGASDVDIRGNSILGNGQAAAIFIQAGSSATINGNNFFGNWPQVYPPEGNCGIVNESGGTTDATNNFWGAATGPGPDPADDVCNVPETDSVTLVTPFATQPFQIPSESPGGGGTNGSPICVAAYPVPNVLWPANHQFLPVWIIGVTDPDNDPIAISITGVTQDEPVNGLGDGDEAPDANVHGSSVDLRAERSGLGNGRVYQVQFTANDGKGASCTGAVTVGVPNSQKPGQEIVDDGQGFDSTQS